MRAFTDKNLLRKTAPVAAFFVSALAGLCFTPPAQAGFSWVAPPVPPVSPGISDGPPVAAMPVPEVLGALVPPSPPSGGDTGVMIEPYPLKQAGHLPAAATDASLAPTTSAKITAVDSEFAPGAFLPQDPAKIQDNTRAVAGFGRDIPLLLVMHQIVPPGLGYSLSKDVDPALRVSWTGGKPWNEVLNDALSPFGLETVVSGNTVMIVPAGMQRRMAGVQNGAYDNSGTPQAFAAPQSLGSLPVSAPASAALAPAATPAIPAIPAIPTLVRAPVSVPPRPVMAVRDSDALEKTTLGDDGRALDPTDIRYWQAESGASLKETLTKWAQSAGVQMFWGGGGDYTLRKPIALHGVFPDAVSEALSAVPESAEKPAGQLYPNLPDGPSVLIVRAGAASAVSAVN